MTKLSSLSLSALRNAPKKLREGQSTKMIGKVIEYTEDTVKVEAMSGLLIGQVVEISPNSRSQVKIKDLDVKNKPKKPLSTTSYTDIGGFVGFDDVRAVQGKDGHYSAYINAFIKEPDEDTSIRPDLKLVSYRAGTGTDREGQPIHFLMSMDAQSEVSPKTIEELEGALVKAVEAGKNAYLIRATADDFDTDNFFKPRGDDSSAEDYVKMAFSGLTEEQLDAYKSDLAAGHITVVEVEPMKIGGKTAKENVEKLETGDRITTINPKAYEAPSLGLRLRAAIRPRKTADVEITEVHAERLKEAFLQTANDTAKAAFHEKGWAAVSDVDLREFFKAHGVELKKHPTIGWNQASVALSKSRHTQAFIAIKTQELYGTGSPYPALKCTQELRAAYNKELPEAILAVTAPEKLAEVKEAAKDAPEAKADEVAAPAEGNMASVDAMLDDIGSEFDDEIAL